MVVAAPAVGELEGPSADDHRPCGHDLVHDLAVHAVQAADDLLVTFGCVRQKPLVQAVPAVAEPLPGPSLGPAMNPSTDIDM